MLQRKSLSWREREEKVELILLYGAGDSPLTLLRGMGHWSSVILLLPIDEFGGERVPKILILVLVFFQG